jgi:hypothetical protein
MMFRALHPDIFTLFSGPNRRVYEEVLVHVYETWIRSDMLFPTQAEVLGVIYQMLSDHPELWREDEAPVEFDEMLPARGRRLRRRRSASADEEATSQAMLRARHIYVRLRNTGWIEESRYGLKTTVDMPAGAMRLIEFLCQMREGFSEELGGLVVEIKTTVEAARLLPRENALGLHKSARDATTFGRYLRSVLSALRDIDRQVLASDSLERRLQHYFEDFVEQVLLRDYAAISTTSHPYRYRHRIFQAIQELEASPMEVQILGEAYLEARLANDVEAARELVFDDLLTIRRVFDRIEDAFLRIQQYRSRLEARLRNTVRYAGRRTGAFLQRSETILEKLDRALATGASIKIEGAFEPVRTPWSPLLLGRGRSQRAPIEGGPIVLRADDPVWALRRQLEREHQNRLTVRPQQVLRYLERQVPPGGERFAANLYIDNLDDFLAFEALRLAAPEAIAGRRESALARRLLEHFELRGAPDDPVDNLWLRSAGFVVRRKEEPPSMVSDHAG